MRNLINILSFSPFALLMTVHTAHATPQDFDAQYFNIVDSKTEITEVTQAEELNLVQEPISIAVGDMPGGPGGIDLPDSPQVPASDALDVIGIFEKAWDILQANKPVVNVETKYASAIPKAAKSNWQLVTGWKPERSFIVNTVYSNGFGMEVIDLKYQVKMLYEGSYKGRGHYLKNVRAIVVDLKVIWGFNMNMYVTIPSIANVGTVEDPIAAIQLDLTMDIRSWTMHRTKTDSYQMQGDGMMKNLITGNVLSEPDTVQQY